jgi:hypothetical protein
MRRPDAASGRKSGGADPDCALAPAGLPRKVKQAHRDNTRRETDQARNDDQPPIVLVGQAVEDTIHFTPHPPCTNNRKRWFF